MTDVAVQETTALESTVRRAAEGDETAFARLVAEHHASMMRVAFVITGDPAVASDAVQAAWATAWQRLGGLRDHAQIHAWLVAIAANEARQALRRGRRRPVVDLSVALDRRGDTIGLVDLERALRRLKSEDRSLIALRYVAGSTRPRSPRSSAAPPRASGHVFLASSTASGRTSTMTDQTTFETRLADSLGRYADRAPTDVDPVALTSAIAARRPASGLRHRPPVRLGHRRAVPALLVLVVAGAIAGVAILGSRLDRTQPAIVLSPQPSSLAPSVEPSPSGPSPSLQATSVRPAAFQWTSPALPGADGLGSIEGLWSVGGRFIATATPVFNDGIDPHRTSFLRSDDGIVWEAVPAPTRGLEIEAGVVEDGVLWLVGNVGPTDDPNRGIWKTRDGKAWERVKNVTGLDFGAGFVSDISQSSADWLAIAYRRLDAESSVPELYRSPDGLRWTKVALPDTDPSFGLTVLVSDGERSVMSLNQRRESDNQAQGSDIWAFTSVNGSEWSRSLVATIDRGIGVPQEINSSDAAFGPEGFVIVGQHVDGEIPDPVAWRSTDGETWTSGLMDRLPGPAGATGLDLVIASDRGYFATGYREEETPTFWISHDGLSWTQTEDNPDLTPVSLYALAANGSRVLVGGQSPGGTAFIWSAPLE